MQSVIGLLMIVGALVWLVWSNRETFAKLIPKWSGSPKLKSSAVPTVDDAVDAVRLLRQYFTEVHPVTRGYNAANACGTSIFETPEAERPTL